MRRWLATGAMAGLLAGCAQQAAVAPPPVVAAVPSSPPTAPAPLPPGASPGMIVPTALADGHYPTPNQHLSPAATLWHLRAAFNVAALACRGPAGDRITAAYNRLLADHRADFAAAQVALMAEYKAQGGDWQDGFDDAMTRLYNFFAQSPARDGFCAAADAWLAGPAPLADADAALAAIDRPFTRFYAAYDAWRRGTAALAVPAPMPTPVIALAATVPMPAAMPPRLAVDPSVFARP